MPIYEFFNIDGEYREVFFNGNDPDLPSIGQIIEHEGESLRRIPSIPGAKVGFRPFASRSLAPGDPDASSYDREGRPVFQSERDVREYMARNNSNPTKRKLVWNE